VIYFGEELFLLEFRVACMQFGVEPLERGSCDYLPTQLAAR